MGSSLIKTLIEEYLYMCDANNINVIGGKRNSKIQFETNFVPPADYKFCNTSKEENNKNSSSKTTFSNPPKTVKEAKEREKKNWYFA